MNVPFSAEDKATLRRLFLAGWRFWHSADLPEAGRYADEFILALQEAARELGD